MAIFPFILPFDAKVFTKAVGGEAAASTNFGLGNTPEDFTSFMSGLPNEPSTTEEIFIGNFQVSEEIPFAMVINSSDNYAFINGTDGRSIEAFSDRNNSLGLGGSIIQNLGDNKYLLNLDDPGSGDDDDNDVLIEIRLEGQNNLFNNGDFELGNIGFYSEYPFNNTQPGGPGVEAYGIGTDASLFNPPWFSFGDHTTGNGNMMVVDGNVGEPLKVVWQQTVPVEQGNYLFEAWVARISPLGEPSANLQFLVNDVLMESYVTETPSWNNVEFEWSNTDPSVTSATFTIVDTDTSFVGNDFVLDDISLTTTASEPTDPVFSTVFGTISGDIIEVKGSNQLVFAGAEADLIDASIASEGGNRIYASSGDDTLILGARDVFVGGEGADRFFVTTGGDNELTGGQDQDEFWIAVAEITESVNTIKDFTMGEDVIGIAGLGIGFDDLSITQEGDNAIIAFDDHSLAIILGTNADSLSAENFAFV